MKTAKEILISLGVDEDNAAAIEIINEARKEIIEKCAEIVETKNTSANPYEPFYEVDKQSILYLISELK